MSTWVISCRKFGNQKHNCPYRQEAKENCFKCNMCFYIERQPEPEEKIETEIKEDEHTV